MSTLVPKLARRAALFALLLGVATCAPPPSVRPAPERSIPDQPVRTRSAMVVSATRAASEVGDRVLKAGGNAVDAAIATGFALAVTYPTAGNIGGGGFMVIRMPDGRGTSIDFREAAPLRSNPQMFLDANGEYSPVLHHNSHRAVGVPGTVAGFALAHARYGSAGWSSLVDPAVRLARDGYVLPPGVARSLASAQRRFAAYPASIQAYSKDGVAYQEGETLRQPDLARTLQRISEHGAAGFYDGETASLLVAEMRRGDGWITEEDLRGYEAKERPTVHGQYRGYDIIGMPPPSSGGTAMIEMLNILEGYDVRSLGHNSARHVHYLAESMRRAFRDRARFLADPDFMPRPSDRLTTKEYAAELRRTIDPDHAGRSEASDLPLPEEGKETTHFSVVDANGMAVSVTYTLEQGYGTGIVVPGAGFLLNNEMGDFNPRPGLTTKEGLIGTDPNLARPGQRMLSSMAPSIVAKDGALVAVIGSPGGRTIINTVLQVVSNVLDFGMDIQQAVNAPRIHHQWLPDQITVESEGFSPAVLDELRGMGHEIRLGGRQGTAHSIMIDPASGARLGAADWRDLDAAAVGH